MGKKSSRSSSSPTKISKHEKKPNINTTNLMKILKPKVYITDTCSFKRLVQDLTGNHQHPPLESSSSPPPPAFVPPSPWEVPAFVESDYYNCQDFQVGYEDNSYLINDVVSLGSSSSLPELSATAPLGESEKMEFYKGLESMLMMEMDSEISSDYDACYHQNQNLNQYQMMFRQDHEVCVYDYDLSNFV